MIVIGIDPGGKGIIHELTQDQDGAWVPGEYIKIPFYTTDNDKEEQDIKAIVDWLSLREKDIKLVVVEDVGYAGGWGSAAKSGFTDSILSRRVGELVGMLKALGKYEYVMVRPVSWQAKLKIKIERIKGESKEKRKKRIKQATIDWCVKQYPTANLIPTGCRKPQDGLADSLAIAHWGVLYLKDKENKDA